MARRITPMLRQQIKGQFKRSQAGGDIVDDTETQEFRKTQQSAVAGVLGGQQSMLNRQAMAAGGGGPAMTGQFAEASRGLTQQGTDAVQKIAGEEAGFKNQLRQQRRAEVMQQGFDMAALNTQKTAASFDMAKSVSDIVNDTAGTITDIYKVRQDK